MDDNDKKTAFDLIEYAGYIRGKYLNIVTHIEKQIDVRIANHFCETEAKSLEIVDVLLGDKYVTFESKRAVFMTIIKKHYIDFYEENKVTLKKMEGILAQRNKFAHLIVAVSDEAIINYKSNRTIGFVKFGQKTETIFYSPKDVQDLLDTAETVRTILLW